MKLAVLQAEVRRGDVISNLSTVKRLIEESNEEINLLTLPELFVTGYNLRDGLNDVAETIPGDGPALSGLCDLAASHNMYIAAGTVEKSSGTLYNCAVLVGPEGYIGHYRKQYLPNFGPFEEKTYFGEGEEIQVFETKIGKIGIQVCYDLFFPRQSTALARGGAEVILNLAASPTTSRPLFHRVLPARAIETTCFWAFANNVGVQGSLSFAGESTIYDPRGKAIASIPAFEEGVAIADISLDDISTFRDLRPVLRDGALREENL